jgi:Tfp pilus assembly protein PilX
MRSAMRNQVPNAIKKIKSEEGFAIPIALGIGLIMILLATTAIVRSHDDRVTSINTKDSARSKLAAESGLAQIQDFINRYRTIARYPACVGNWNSDGTCSDPGTAASWAKASNLPPTLDALCSATSGATAAQTAVQGWANASWKEVDPADTGTDPTQRKGQFRLLRYAFSDTSSAGQEGVLTVEGRVNGDQPNEAITQLNVRISIFPSGQLVSPLWASGTVSGNPQINGDALRPCGSTTAVTFPSTSYKVIQSRIPIPASVAAPTANFAALTNISTIPGRELPRATDTADPADGIYKYTVASFDESFQVKPGTRVSLWVTGNLDLSDRTIVNQCAGDDNCTPFDVRIYGTTGTLTLNPGTRICDVLFHMPNYDVSSTTSSAANTTQNCGDSAVNKKNTGIYWVRNWSASGTGPAIDEPRVRWSHPDVPATVLPPPTLGPVKEE